MTLRPATMADVWTLLIWRDDPETRANSRTTERLNFRDHHAWLARTLADPDHRLVIAEAITPLGTCRADRTADGWKLSWTVAPLMRGVGIGTKMVGMFVATLDGHLTAEIKSTNVASLCIARRFGIDVTLVEPSPPANSEAPPLSQRSGWGRLQQRLKARLGKA